VGLERWQDEHPKPWNWFEENIEATWAFYLLPL
jgi:hypothetical protein